MKRLISIITIILMSLASVITTSAKTNTLTIRWTSYMDYTTIEQGGEAGFIDGMVISIKNGSKIIKEYTVNKSMIVNGMLKDFEIETDEWKSGAVFTIAIDNQV
jgi:hypothetical protein